MYQYQIRQRREKLIRRLTPVLFTVGLLAYAYLLYFIATTDFCPLWYGVKCF